MAADERRSPEERERQAMARVDMIEDLMTGFLAELRVHIGQLRIEIDSQEHPREQ